MVKINAIKLNRLRNEIHFQFCTDFKNLVSKFNPMLLRIENPFNLFHMLYEQEDHCLRLILRSAATENLNNADHRRDVALHGLSDSIAASLDHFNPEVVEASKRLSLLFNWYAALPRKSFDEETQAIENMVNELRGKFILEVGSAGLLPWVEELDVHNRRFIRIMEESCTGNSGTTGLRIKNMRVEMDKLYHVMSERIDALMLVENNAFYEQFICELNSHIDRYDRKMKNAEKR